MKIKRLLTVGMAAALVLSLAGTATAAEPKGGAGSKAPKTDNLSHPLGDKQAALREAGLQKVMKGEAKTSGDNKVVKVAKGQYVELAREGEDTIWTVLGQFGTQVNPTYPGTGDPGPLHNQIPEPDRNVDNTSIWTPDSSKAYYEDMLFSEAPGDVSMRNYYIEQSSNRYTVNGTVEDWVQVPFNEANYGSNYCGDIVCARTWLFVRDSVNAWYNARVADGWTAQDFTDYLAQFDVWDRYDYDGDGNFNEPDGYIDHFQSVHAGSGEETGGGAQGTDAIWSHRWYAFYNNIGVTGPSADYLLGGIKIGGTNFWIGDYTVEPEDGGVGVFAHEFGHDLGLPDLYDTSGNTGGAENSVAFWSLYSSGSYGSTGIPADGIGSKPIPMSAYEKIFLGWSDYDVVGYGQKKTVRLGPATNTTKQAQAIVALLPDKSVTTNIGTPYAGSNFYHSGAGNDLDNSMTRSVTLPAGTVNLAAKVRYDIEQDWDYAYLTVNGAGVHTNLSTATDPNGQNFGEGITGSSGGNWVDLTADLSAFAGQTVTLGFRYWTDGAVAGSGFGVDEIAVTGQPTDGAESDAGWTFDGFSATTGSVTQSYFNAYFAENRQYTGYDDGLRTGPYNFGFNNTTPNWVEHFKYQPGLLVWYYDTSFHDNNIGDNCLGPDTTPGTSDDRCGGLVLPVDAHPTIAHWADGTMMRPRIQSFDSTFGLSGVPALTLHNNGVAATIPASPAAKVFNDSTDQWFACDSHCVNGVHDGRYQPGWSGVNTPATGTTMRVKSVSSTGFMEIDVNK